MPHANGTQAARSQVKTTYLNRLGTCALNAYLINARQDREACCLPAIFPEAVPGALFSCITLLQR